MAQITKSVVEARITGLTDIKTKQIAEYEKAKATVAACEKNLHALDGAIQDCNYWLTELAKPDAEALPPPAATT